jgi:hypothetical protein
VCLWGHLRKCVHVCAVCRRARPIPVAEVQKILSDVRRLKRGIYDERWKLGNGLNCNVHLIHFCTRASRDMGLVLNVDAATENVSAIRQRRTSLMSHGYDDAGMGNHLFHHWNAERATKLGS